MTDAEIADVVSGALTLDVSTALQNWINYVSATSGTGYAPKGTYRHNTPLEFKNNGVYRGAGWGATSFRYYGSLDQAYISNPSNSSTQAYIVIEDIVFFKPGGAVAGKANFVDNGSSFIHFNRCQFSSAMIGLILDQTEIASVTDCVFSIANSANAIGLWMIDGADRTVGNSAGYTNQIRIEGNQFDGTTGVGVAIADDGGYDHCYRSNNFNAIKTAVRVAGVRGFALEGGEYETGGVSACVTFAATKFGGSAAARYTSSASIYDGFWVPGGSQPVVTIAAGCVTSLYMNGLNVESTLAGIISGANNCTDFHSENVNQWNAGSNVNFSSNNSHFSVGTFTPALKFNSLSVGMTTSAAVGSYQRAGNVVHFQCSIILTAKGSSTGSATITGLPFTSSAVAGLIPPLAIVGNNMSAGTNSLQALVPVNSTSPQLYNFAAGVATQLADTNFTNTSVLYLSGSYSTLNKLA